VNVLVDTSVWINHLRHGVSGLARLLEDDAVITHAFVIGELACGNLSPRGVVLALLNALPHVVVAEHEEVLAMVEEYKLMGSGIGWIDAHLLASARIAGVQLWTADRNLARIVRDLGMSSAV